MCGILGIFDVAPGTTQSTLRAKLIECARRMRHRGPGLERLPAHLPGQGQAGIRRGPARVVRVPPATVHCGTWRPRRGQTCYCARAPGHHRPGKWSPTFIRRGVQGLYGQNFD